MSSAVPSPHPQSQRASELSSLKAESANVSGAPATILPIGGVTEALVTLKSQRCSNVSTIACRSALAALRRRISFLLKWGGVKPEKTPLNGMRMRVPFLQDDRTENIGSRVEQTPPVLKRGAAPAASISIFWPWRIGDVKKIIWKFISAGMRSIPASFFNRRASNPYLSGVLPYVLSLSSHRRHSAGVCRRFADLRCGAGPGGCNAGQTRKTILFRKLREMPRPGQTKGRSAARHAHNRLRLAKDNGALDGGYGPDQFRRHAAEKAAAA